MSSSAVQPLLALLAYPAGGNPKQYVFERAFKHHNLDWRYLTFEIEAERLARVVDGLRELGFRGGHIATPLEQAAITSLDRVTETASLVGAANRFFWENGRFVGDYSAGQGLLAAVRRETEPAATKVVLLGQGPMARAVAVAFLEAGAARVTMTHASEADASESLSALSNKYSARLVIASWTEMDALLADADILVNTIDGEDNALPIALEGCRPELLVVDVSPQPRTPLIDGAATRGCRTIDGLTLWIESAAVDFCFWTGVEPDRRVLREAVEEYWEF